MLLPLCWGGMLCPITDIGSRPLPPPRGLALWARGCMLWRTGIEEVIAGKATPGRGLAAAGRDEECCCCCCRGLAAATFGAGWVTAAARRSPACFAPGCVAFGRCSTCRTSGRVGDDSFRSGLFLVGEAPFLLLLLLLLLALMERSSSMALAMGDSCLLSTKPCHGLPPEAAAAPPAAAACFGRLGCMSCRSTSERAAS